MSELFGKENIACTEIWRQLYIKDDEEDPRPEKTKRWKPPAWLKRTVDHLGVDKLVDLIPYTSDVHLMDEQSYWSILSRF